MGTDPRPSGEASGRSGIGHVRLDLANGQVALTFAEWLVQARLPQHRRQAEEAVKQNHLVAWLDKIGERDAVSRMQDVTGIDQLLDERPTGISSSTTLRKSSPKNTGPSYQPRETASPNSSSARTNNPGTAKRKIIVVFCPILLCLILFFSLSQLPTSWRQKPVLPPTSSASLANPVSSIPTVTNPIKTTASNKIAEKNCLLKMVFNGHTDLIDSVCFSPDGSRLATGSYDRTVKIWNAETGQESLTLKGHTGALFTACVSALVVPAWPPAAMTRR